MNVKLSPKDLDALRAKVQVEFDRADRHTQNWKNEVKDLSREYLLPKPGEDKVKIRKVLNNLNIRLATFLSDELQVTNVPMNGVLGQEVAKNTDKVFQANFESMKIKSKYREVLIDDALQGVGVLAVDGWNEHKQEPIVSYIDSRLCYPDPNNWQDSKMSFFGTKLRKNWYELEADEAYDNEALKMCKLYLDTDINEVKRAEYEVKDFTEVLDGDDSSVDVYNHITIFKAEEDEKPCVYLATYGAGSTLLRLVKIRPLTKAEESDPSEIDFGVRLFRAKPLKGSFAGVSLIDDVGQFQDIETLLTNLQINQAKEAGLGGKTYVNTELGVDMDDVANYSGPGDVVPFTSTNPNINAQNGIFQEPTRPQNPIISNTINYLSVLSDKADPSGNSLAQGQSQAGSQTKAEIQTLQQNINHILTYMSSNYMDSLKGLWTSIYRSYETNMSSQKKKEIVVVDGDGKSEAYGFRKREFIAGGEVYIKIKSKAQEDIKNKQDFAVLLSVYGSLAAAFPPGSRPKLLLDRMLVNKSGIRGVDGETLIPLSNDERKAYNNLELLNNDVELKSKPEPGEDHNTFINIYKTGLQTNARDKAIELRELMLLEEPEQGQQPQQQGGGVAQQLGASMLASDTANQVPSVSDVQA